VATPRGKLDGIATGRVGGLRRAGWLVGAVVACVVVGCATSGRHASGRPGDAAAGDAGAGDPPAGDGAAVDGPAGDLSPLDLAPADADAAPGADDDDGRGGGDATDLGSDPAGNPPDASGKGDGDGGPAGDATLDGLDEVIDAPDGGGEGDAGDAISEEEDAFGESDAAPTCDEIIARIDAERASAATCVRSAECAVRANPLCPYGGCYTFYATGWDPSALEVDEAAFLGPCGSNRCACAPNPPAVLSCTDGLCGACPTECPSACTVDCSCVLDACGCPLALCADGAPESCSALADALNLAQADGAGCTEDDDCTVFTPDQCPALPCFVGINRNASPAQLAALAQAYLDDGCAAPESCGCSTPPAVACIDHRCVTSP
jgi:hypothetical protein